MESTTRSGSGRRAEQSGRRAAPERIASRSVSTGFDDDPGRAFGGGAAAVIVALAGAVAVAAAPLLGGVTSTADGEWASGSSPGAVWAAVCVIAPALLALVSLLARRVAVAGAVLAGSGVVALGAAVIDAQLWTDAVDANRLELFRPETAVDLVAGPGAYLVLAGHLTMALAGLLGIFTVHRASLADGYGGARSSEQVGRPTGARIGFAASALVAMAAVVFGGALFAPALISSDPMVLVPTVLDADVTASTGAGILAAAVLLVVASALASIAPPVAGAGIVGAGFAALGVVGTRFVSALTAGDRIEPGIGSVVGTIAAAILVLAGVAVVPVDRVRDRRILRDLGGSSGLAASDADGAATPPTKKGAVHPSAKGVAKAAMRAEAAAAAQRRTRWHMATGIVGVTVGVLAACGALLPALDLDEATDTASLQVYATRLVLVAGVLLVVSSVWLLFSEFAAAVRPVVGVVWTAIPFAAIGVTASVVTAGEVPGVGIGIGALLAWVAAVGAVGVGAFAGFAGSAEREEIDESEGQVVHKPVLFVGGLGALIVVVGLALPLYAGVDVRGDEYVSVTLVDYSRGLEWWGPAMLVIVTLVSVGVAVGSRPMRSAATLVGSMAVLVVYLAGWPLTSARVEQVQPGMGFYTVGLGIVLIGAAAILTVRVKSR
ncbi:MAG: hypothetical protein GX610_06950 [Rhodococcus sp.]|nr:hypothetical protein [Rhodococcus sp. (in: high G+C Gram-positive bacteria)]